MIKWKHSLSNISIKIWLYALNYLSIYLHITPQKSSISIPTYPRGTLSLSKEQYLDFLDKSHVLDNAYSDRNTPKRKKRKNNSINSNCTNFSEKESEEGCSSSCSVSAFSLRVESQLNGFDYLSSIAWKALRWHFSTGIRLKELTSISIVAAMMLQIAEPTRDQKRSFPLLIKWFSDNWENIEKIIPFIHLRDASNQIIDCQRELTESFYKVI